MTIPFLKTISNKEIIDFTRGLLLLIKSGIPIARAFHVLAEQTKNPHLRRSLLTARIKIERGTAIHKALTADKNFGTIYLSFIRIGEEAGNLEQNLDFLINWLEQENTLKSEISSATLYPKIVLTFAFFLAAGLSLFVLPRLILVFEGLDVTLPLSTRILLWISQLMQNHGSIIFLGIIGLVILFFLLRKLDRFKRMLDVLTLKIPYFGTFMQEYQLAVIAQLAAILFKSGIPIVQIFEMLNSAVTNSQYQDSLAITGQRINRGTPLSDALKRFPKLYPNTFVYVIGIGETSGAMEQCFTELASFFQGKVKEKARRLPTVLEPVMLIVIGLVVAFIASAIILPIYEITRAF